MQKWGMTYTWGAIQETEWHGGENPSSRTKDKITINPWEHKIECFWVCTTTIVMKSWPCYKSFGIKIQICLHAKCSKACQVCLYNGSVSTQMLQIFLTKVYLPKSVLAQMRFSLHRARKKEKKAYVYILLDLETYLW